MPKDPSFKKVFQRIRAKKPKDLDRQFNEAHEEVFETIEDLAAVKVDIVTIGQYLQPTAKHLLIHEFITPEKFEVYRQFALKLGFKHVESSPLVRSSYHAEKHIH